MINKLRKKFIIIAMGTMTFVLFVIILVINCVNYSSIVSEADKTLKIISDNNGTFPMNNPTNELVIDKSDETSSLETNNSTSENNSNTSSNSNNTTQPNPNDGKKPDQGGSLEKPFETRYFTVTLDENGSIESVNLDRIASVNESTAKEYALDLYSKNKQKGFYKNFRYLLSLKETTTMYIFVDCTSVLDTFYTFLWQSITISVIGLVVVLVIILFTSKLVFKPVLESYNKQKQFITDANHELKTPLTVINASCDVLTMSIGENEWVSDIKNQVNTLTELTNELVYLSKMDENNTTIDMSSFNLSNLLNEEINSFSVIAASTNKILNSNVEENVTYNGNSKQITRLISILLDNAFKYTNDKGQIDISLSKKKNTINLIVSNTTNGIPKGDLSRLFDRFYRLDDSRNSETGGHGLGLSIAKLIVDNHKGKINAYSEDGITIFFKVSL